MPGESLVQVTSGAGPKLHTWQRTIGANNVEDEVIIQGENYLATYMVTTGGGTAPGISVINKHLIQVMAGASLKVRIRRIEISQVTAATAAGVPVFRIFRLTTAGTGGTAITPAPLDTADSAAGCTVMTAPTALGTEGTLISGHTFYNIQTIGASTVFASPTLVIDYDRPRSKPLIIQAGAANGIAIKNVTTDAAATYLINIWLDESSF